MVKPVKINYGRKRIILNYDKVTPSNFREVFDAAFPVFGSNKGDCKYLIDVYLGKQDILDRPAPNTTEINNKCVVNYAYPITREIVGYTFGNAFEFAEVKNEFKEDANFIDDIYDYEGGYATDLDAGTYASICGMSYEIVMPSAEITKDETPEIPIVLSALDPRHTFVVQSTQIGNPQIMSCIEVEDVTHDKVKYICFTDEYKFEIDPKADDNKFTYEKNKIGRDPIQMIENNLLLTGDWEMAIPVMNALNQLTSDSLNDVESAIQSLLVILGTDIPDPSTTLATIKNKRLLSLFAPQGQGSVDAKFISPELSSQEVSDVREFLIDAQNIIVGIPDRQSSGSTGDTGVAVINRNGWTDIEIVAKQKELLFKKAKKKQLQVVIAILKKLGLVNDKLSAVNISVNLGRDTVSGLSEKAQAFSTLVATGELATIDALTFSGLTNRVNEVVERGKEAKAEREKAILENETIATNNANNANNKEQESK